MFRFHIITLGCKINLYESESISFNLQKKNNIKENNLTNCDVIIINTCTVTAKADSKSRNIIRHARKENPDAIILVCGCLVETDIDELLGLNTIDIFVLNKDKDKINEIIDVYKNIKKRPLIFKSDNDGSFNFTTHKLSDHSRAFLKVQDGCDNFCSYCKIPYARGKSRSRDIDEILIEIEAVINNGYEEIILTGINLGSFNHKDFDFNGLLKIVSENFKNIRFRISSIELEHINRKFLEIYKYDNICPHIHIPLQSGSNKILKLMNRKYTIEDYQNKITEIRKIKKNPFVSTDLIIGFPSEDNEDFKSTIELINNIDFSYIHLFRFSPRKGTKAYDLKPKIPEYIIKERLNILKREVSEMNLNYRNRFLGKNLEILIEKKENQIYKGKSENYIDLIVETDQELSVKKRYSVKFEKINNDKNYCTLLG